MKLLKIFVLIMLICTNIATAQNANLDRLSILAQEQKNIEMELQKALENLTEDRVFNAQRIARLQADSIAINNEIQRVSNEPVSAVSVQQKPKKIEPEPQNKTFQSWDVFQDFGN